MKFAVYNWKNMVRDYCRLMLDDKWYWCRNCRRPVEHTYTQPEGDAQEALSCLDCGYADPYYLRTILRG